MEYVKIGFGETSSTSEFITKNIKVRQIFEEQKDGKSDGKS